MNMEIIMLYSVLFAGYSVAAIEKTNGEYCVVVNSPGDIYETLTFFLRIDE